MTVTIHTSKPITNIVIEASTDNRGEMTGDPSSILFDTESGDVRVYMNNGDFWPLSTLIYEDVARLAAAFTVWQNAMKDSALANRLDASMRSEP